MKLKNLLSVFLILFVLSAFFACKKDPPTSAESEEKQAEGEGGSTLAKGLGSGLGRIIVANRASSDISVIDTDSDQVIGTHNLPGASNPAEPMYVVYSSATNRIFVGDRANNCVVAFNADDFSVDGTVITGAGVFHMWADFFGANQLWVNNDIDKTTSVVDPVSLTVITTIPTPADLVALGGKPHDVILDPKGHLAYMTVINVSGNNDFVVQYETQTFQEIGRAAVGNSAHVSLSPKNRNLYVTSQGDSTVYVFDRATLSQVTTIPVPNTHGAATTLDGQVFYTTNISGSGTQGLFTIDARSNSVAGSIDTPFATPHNIAFAPHFPPALRPQKLYVTHSGATADQVTVYDVSHRLPVYLTTITAGLNPYGLAFTK